MRNPMRMAGSCALPATAASAPDDPLMTPGDAGRPPAPRLGAPGRARAFSTAGDVPESKEEGRGALRPGPSTLELTLLELVGQHRRIEGVLHAVGPVDVDLVVLR